MATILIGTSGFSYDHWSNGVFYPRGFSKAKWLGFYAEHFSSVELNVTFYRLPRAKTYVGWHDRTPKDFQFILKGSRYITHIKRLHDADESLEMFFDQARGLKKKFAVALWQMPPSMHLNIERLAAFIKLLKKFKKVRHAFEFRHASWWCDEAYELIAKNKMAFCHADYLQEIPDNIPDDMPFHYARFHGFGSRYGGDYPHELLDGWAKKLAHWSKKGMDSYVFFNNDAAGFAVKNAMELKRLV